ncbi:hypothetical protein [Natrialba asiatica]|uniref:Uncharacterized protein n=1 Tax=Natrialba asiatica (strain ATCC 700177 / DSM 12278 / JCM 9576 / FERM P-10747 / NBRC 102637 / 172P1) TaxID=29540 RepID=M0AQ42_NATA1|nr:hypothetical protein [Natrialba asiatica]ELZ00851.1 hypothetical protein C481_11470 [Natrialba asiatica DSM 12278]
MNTRNKLGTAFVVLAIVLFTVPALFPVQAVLTHDTRDSTSDGQEQLEEQGTKIVEYDNLSEKGQELYVQALENGGEYRVSTEQGAPEFDYMTSVELAQRQDENPEHQPGFIAIERPDDADLPPADEPSNRGPSENDEEYEQHREQVQRYDLMTLSKGPPPLGATPQLLRLAASLLAVISFGIGGYLLSSKST